ncbi:MAG: hypothetical protein FD136_1452 [Chitinophagaceae bacterium]|nr:MAG: hypothetical protein FD136_1452 [Chitinophagaceae bacterium]
MVEGTLIKPEDFTDKPIADAQAAAEAGSASETANDSVTDSTADVENETAAEEAAIDAEAEIIEGDVSDIAVNNAGELIIKKEEEDAEDQSAENQPE